MPYAELFAALERGLVERGPECELAYRALCEQAESDPDRLRAARERGRAASRLARARYGDGNRAGGDTCLAEQEALLALHPGDGALAASLAGTLVAALDRFFEDLSGEERAEYGRWLLRLGTGRDGERGWALPVVSGLAGLAQSYRESGDLESLQRCLARARDLVAHAEAGAAFEAGSLLLWEVRIGVQLVEALCAADRIAEAGQHLIDLERRTRRLPAGVRQGHEIANALARARRGIARGPASEGS